MWQLSGRCCLILNIKVNFGDELGLILCIDVVPHDKPVKLIRNFREYVRLFIFSFIQYDPDAHEEDEDPMQIK